jgi:hypothetical protein
MGARGPVPNRSEDLARDRSRKGGDVVAVTKGIAYPVDRVPEPDMDWHPIAVMLWNSLESSGQSAYYQNSDWAYAFSVCDDLSLYKKQGRRSAQMLTAINSAMEKLLLTEGDRRRVRIELDPPPPDEPTASVTAIADYKQGLGLVPPLPPETDET